MLTVYEPKPEDLWFKQQMLADPETMSYNHACGGTIPFPREKWQAWYDKWLMCPDGSRFYRYLKNEAGGFVGEMAYHYDEDIRGYMADVIIYAEYRGRGYGGRALDMLCEAARANGIAALHDDIAIDNPSVSLFLRHGFTEEYRTDAAVMLVKKL